MADPLKKGTSMTDFTPGPWKHSGGSVFVDTRTQVCCQRGHAECCGVPDVEGDYFEVAQCNEANAPLIAAAPDLYAALRGMVAAFETLHSVAIEADAFAHARAALAKARGG